MAYTRPDSVGQLEPGKDPGKGELKSLLDIVPLQTRSDWAWVPGITWAPNGKTLYRLSMSLPRRCFTGGVDLIYLAAVPSGGGQAMRLVSQSGMFAYPIASSFMTVTLDSNSLSGGLFAGDISNQSETSRYHVAVINQDGSNRRLLFPSEGAPGMDPQAEWGVWSPAVMPDLLDYCLAVIYQKNIWLVDATNGTARTNHG